MEDVGEKGRPPGDPPDAPGSWVRKFLGCNEGGMPIPEEVVDEEFVEARLKLEFPNGEDGEPVITIGEEVLTEMNKMWKRCMIVKVLGRSVPLMSLTRKLKELWRPTGTMFVTDLPRNFCLVRFGSEEEYMNALTGGPWRAFGSYLMVQAWTPDFEPLRDEIVTNPIWVRLAHIPVNFYHKTILMGIAKGLGRPIKVDLTTLKVERARFARICVEVNINKPLKWTVLVNGERYCVSYEGISTICPLCGLYGHLAPTCPKRLIESAPITTSNQLAVVTEGMGAVGMEAGFTPVRQAKKKPEQQSKLGGGRRSNDERVLTGSKKGLGSGTQKEYIGGEGIAKDVMVSNRFGGLSEEGEMEEQVEDMEKEDGNKENRNNANIKGAESSKEVGKVVAFAAHGNNGNNERRIVNRDRLKDKKAGNLRGPNQIRKNNGPTRGLVFGPARGEIDLSGSGKRLRVEKESVGRPGGVFAGDGETDKHEENLDHVGEHTTAASTKLCH
ncbi:hypothetical protein Bca52824_026465 [Brassica carinata]|uniref:DUF4283 domain-containing protein n=1 Tax=Brassica carinata TaxID=52824 RepID=A0A8X7SIM6_BRACI|nr:hypothetical protein Bca52824_026465 [Brassica carinata]